jgi:hypothetical protein
MSGGYTAAVVAAQKAIDALLIRSAFSDEAIEGNTLATAALDAVGFTDLLEALEAVRSRGLPDRYTSDAELAAQVDAAIARAKGETA